MLALVNGVDLAYDVAGSPARPWVVLVHGFPFTRASWAAQAAALAPDFRVLTWDLRGLGASPLGPAPQPLETYVDDLLGLMDTLGVARAGLAGLSMGGYIALRAVERAPERFWALALCDTRSEPDTDEGKLGRAAAIQALHRGGVEPFVRGLLPKLLLRPESPAGRDLLERMLSNGAAGMANALAAMQGRTDTTPALAKIEIPTLVLVGSGDALTPPGVARDLAARIRGARLEVLENAGHVSNLEAPEAFDAALTGFFRDAASRS
jgi:pimeloyl-ACP methyl ester carboxylesterase